MLRKNVYIRYLRDMIIWFVIVHKGIVILMIDTHLVILFIHKFLILYVCRFVLLLWNVQISY